MNRRILADSIDGLDEQIAELNREKAEFYAAYREQLEKEGRDKDAVRLELAALKSAIRHRRKLNEDRDAVLEKNDLIDAIVDEITRPGTPVATRAHTARVEPEPPAERPAPIKPLPSSEMPDLPPELDRRQQARAQ